MARHGASDLAIRLGRQAEAVCREYLSSGRRSGNYWLVGDVQNSPGRSLYVRLKDTAKGPAGKWTDGATGEHGDLLDVIREALGLIDFKDVAEEARRFLSLPHPEPSRPRTPTGMTSSMVSLRLKGACFDEYFLKSGSKAICVTLRMPAQSEAIFSAPVLAPPWMSTISACFAWT